MVRRTKISRRKRERTPLWVEIGFVQRENLYSGESAALGDRRTRRTVVGSNGIATLICQRTKAGYEEFVPLRKKMFHN
jgi:hypothetical protein